MRPYHLRTFLLLAGYISPILALYLSHRWCLGFRGILILYTFRTAGAWVSGEFLFYTPSALLVLICDFPKPQRGERCIVRIDQTNRKPRGAKGVPNALTFFTELTHKVRFSNQCRIPNAYSAINVNLRNFDFE